MFFSLFFSFHYSGFVLKQFCHNILSFKNILVSTFFHQWMFWWNLYSVSGHTFSQSMASNTHINTHITRNNDIIICILSAAILFRAHNVPVIRRIFPWRHAISGHFCFHIYIVCLCLLSVCLSLSVSLSLSFSLSHTYTLSLFHTHLHKHTNTHTYTHTYAQVAIVVTALTFLLVNIMLINLLIAMMARYMSLNPNPKPQTPNPKP